MPTLPWARSIPSSPSASRSAPEADVLLLGSRLTLASYRHTFGFLRAALRLRRQVVVAPGARGVSLVAQPMRRTYWTLSAWSDQGAIDAFVRSPPHVEVMDRYGARLANAAFTTWRVPATALPTGPTGAGDLWHEARRRLATEGAPREDEEARSRVPGVPSITRAAPGGRG